MDTQQQQNPRTLNMINPNIPLRQAIIKMLKVKDKEGTLKTEEKKDSLYTRGTLRLPADSGETLQAR